MTSALVRDGVAVLMLVALTACSSSSGAGGAGPAPAGTPPPLDTGRPGTVRLRAASRPGIPPFPVVVTLANGVEVRLALGEIEDGGEAMLGVGTAAGSTGDTPLLVREGDVRPVGRVLLHVLHVWVTPDYAHRALDVEVTPAS